MQILYSTKKIFLLLLITQRYQLKAKQHRQKLQRYSLPFHPGLCKCSPQAF